MAQRQITNTKPRSLPEQSRRLAAVFSSEDQVLITVVADPDSLASALAMKRFLWRKVAGVTITRINEISRPDNLAMVRLLKIPLKPYPEVDPTKFTKKVLVDGQPHHHAIFEALKYDVIIDHHPLGERSREAAFVDIRPKYGANSTIMTEYLKGAKIVPSARLATALIYGIRTDTSTFGRPVLQEDVNAFQYLFPKINQNTLRKIEFSEMRLGDLALLKQALGCYRMRGHSMFAHLGPVKSPDNLVQIADFFLKVDLVDSCAISGVYQDKLVVIIRNTSMQLSAGRMASRAFGELGSAGGHKATARAEIPLAELKKLLSEEDMSRLADFVVRRLQRAKAHKKK
ncbi:MAG: DHH family phosphoesterase [Deltaproteobacteria bacterium]|nr:DHH family phosphoesterase [Deltaproteobacteria bacterium]